MVSCDVYSDIYGDLYGSCNFPQGILGLKVELQLSGTWTDISSYVYQGRSGPGAVISRGHPDESTTTNPSTLTMVLNNRDGRFSSRYPTGAYYGSIGRNTPVRVSTPEAASYLRSETDQTSYASAPDSAGLSITGDTELQIDLTLSNWRAATILAAKWADTGNQRSWLLLLDEAGTLTFKWSANGTAITTATSTAAIPVPALRRQAIKVTLAVATGTVTFYTAPAAADQSGPITTGWTITGAAVVAGAAAVYDGTAQVQAGYCSDAATEASTYTGYYGKLHSFRLLNGIAGTTKASPDFTYQTAGASSFADGQSNTWTLHGTSELSSRKYRFHGEVSAWPQAWDPSGTDVYVNVTASGLLRRYSQNNSTASTMTRYWSKLTGTYAPAAYWPCEDLAGAASLASGLASGTAMTLTGSPASTLATSSPFTCSGALPAVGGGIWTGYVPAPASGSDSVATFLVSIPSGGTTNNAPLVLMQTSSGGFAYLTYLTASSGTLETVGPLGMGGNILTGVNGNSYLVQLALQQSGSDTAWHAQIMQPGDTSATVQTGTLSSYTAGTPVSVIVNADTFLAGDPPVDLGTTVVGHVAAQSAWQALSNLSGPLSAYAGEVAGTRFARLCTEESIAFRSQGQLSTTTAMGTQAVATVSTLLQECEDADRGMIVEPRQVLGLGYRTRGSLRNQSAALALSYTSAHLAGSLTPTDDDQYTTNDVTVTRTGGSSARQVLSTGALSTGAPPSGVGRYATTATLNVWQDYQALQEAGWMLHLGTVDQPRYPLIQVSLARSQVTTIYFDLQDADLGDRLTVSGTPVWLPPDGITQLIQGLNERLGGYTFEIDWQGVPESPYKTLIVGDTTYGHVETDGSTLASNIASGAASMSVTTTTSGTPIWTTSDAPFDVIMGGERITVTAISGSSSPQTFTITRAVNGVTKAHTAGESVSLFYPATLA